MRAHSVHLAEIAVINPRAPQDISPGKMFALLPMAAVSAELSEVQPVETVRAEDVKTGLTYFEDGDILVAKITPCFENGKIALVRSRGEAGFGSTEFHVIRASEKIDRKYLTHLMRQPSVRVAGQKRMTGSAGQKRVPRSFLEELEILLPPLDEQKRIAAILDQADELRRKRQRAIDRLNQLGQAIFHEMFGDAATNAERWKTVQLSDVVRSGDKINYGVVQPGDDVEDGVPLIRVGDLLSGYIDPTKVKQIDASIEANYKRSRLVGDEILIGCVGSIGSVALAHEGLRGANIARAVARVPVDHTVAVRDFIAEQIKSAAVQRYFTAETRTVAQPTLNIGLIESAPIILPPISEQKKFAALVSNARNTLKHLVEHASIEEALFSALQHRAFQGEL